MPYILIDEEKLLRLRQESHYRRAKIIELKEIIDMLRTMLDNGLKTIENETGEDDVDDDSDLNMEWDGEMGSKNIFKEKEI